LLAIWPLGVIIGSAGLNNNAFPDAKLLTFPEIGITVDNSSTHESGGISAFWRASATGEPSPTRDPGVPGYVARFLAFVRTACPNFDAEGEVAP
jgi:hypothetical protein